MKALKALLLGASAFGVLPAMPALAAEAATDTAPAVTAVEEVTVTAQKREENIQDVPLSIMAVSGKTLAANGVNDVKALEHIVPSLRLDTIAQASGLTLRIRGFGANSNAAIDPSVAPYIDGVYIPRPGAMLTSFLDIDAVEVLRGPQGTLFGRNATVGAISLRTTAPVLGSNSGEVAGELGNYGTRKLQGVGNLALGEAVAVRIAALGQHTDGFIYNQLDGKRYGASTTGFVRGSVKARLSDAITWTGRADYARITGDNFNLSQVDVSSASAAQLAAFTARTGGNPSPLDPEPLFRANERFDSPAMTDRQYGFSSDLSAEIPHGYTVRLIDAYRNWSNRQTDGDVVFTPLDLLNRHSTFDSSSQSHELQLLSPTDKLLGGRFSFVAGLYYFEENYSIGETFDLGSQFCGFLFAAKPGVLAACNAGPQTTAADGHFHQHARSLAAYVQTDFKITPTLDLILGARETRDTKTGSFVQLAANPALGAGVLRAPENTDLRFHDSRPSWRANLTWHVTPDVMAFVTYSTGYKSGGLNSAGGAAPLGQKRLFDSESSKDVEVGVKSVLFDRRLLLNATFFNTDLDGFQERSFDGVSFVIRNAGSVRARGVELEGQARPVDHVKLDFGVAYLDSVYSANHQAPGLPACTGLAGSCPTVQDLTGRTTAYSPKWQVDLGAEYDTPSFEGGWTAQIRGALNYSSKIYTTPDLSPQAVVDGVTTLGARVTLVSPDQSWSVAVFGDNLTNEHYFRLKFAQVLDSAFGVRDPATGNTLMRGFLGAPRTYGVRVSHKF
ncbi:MAG TPA: TonB-dependent receptor [Caulobacteraceae bacterium]|nr:TonB-dependent receptor [Caulobacteraceae bacterium]